VWIVGGIHGSVYSNLELARHHFYVPSTQLPTGHFFGVQIHPRGTLSRFVAIQFFHFNTFIRLIRVEPSFNPLHHGILVSLSSWTRCSEP
jgi:hypothetical protein